MTETSAEEETDTEGEGDPADGPRAIGGTSDRIDRVVHRSEQVMQWIELVAGFVLVALFAIGVFDLGLQILKEIRSGDISDPLVVIGFIDTALLLFIIVEVYQTVVAYARSDETARILRLVIFTGVIALVRKAIVFRTGEYATKTDALLVAVAYATLTIALALLLYVSYQYVGGREDEPAQY
ncbi:MAG: phosphate-starvation-inducible PsiE family protein [Halorientalis sp.]